MNDSRSEIHEGRPLAEVTESLAADKAAYDREEPRVGLLYELPLRLAESASPDALLQEILDALISGIPGAMRGAILLLDPTEDGLLLKAHRPAGKPAVSLTLAERAIGERRAFVWPPEHSAYEPKTEQTVPASVSEHDIQSAMYVPLLWKGRPLGVVCLDNKERSPAFEEEDLRLLLAVAHQVAALLANAQALQRLEAERAVLANTLKLVSPQFADRIRRHRGRLRLGGEFRDVTLLFSDIRGFTRLSASLHPDSVTEMLEDYFAGLVPVVFKHRGLIDKFVGDAILAVFGSPEPDDDQHLHAVRTALDMQAVMKEVNERRSSAGKVVGELGIGVHCGEVVHGLVGAQERMEYTVVGDAVNRASRYCDGAGGGEVLVSPEIFARLYRVLQAEPVTIPTKHEGPLEAFRVERLKV